MNCRGSLRQRKAAVIEMKEYIQQSKSKMWNHPKLPSDGTFGWGMVPHFYNRRF